MTVAESVLGNDLTLEEAAALTGRQWGWTLGLGVAYVLLGVVALSLPIASTIGLVVALAAILTVNGLLRLINGVRCKRGRGILLFQALVSLATGAIIFWYPGLGMLGITLVLSVYFFLTALMHAGARRGITSSKVRWWNYLNVAACFFIGAYILLTLPISALWVPGALLGIEFLVGGSTLIVLALAARRVFRGPKTFSGGLSPSRQPV